ncbi:hypothetical protein HII36_22405 [Nonomuraea sp. NN258]|nr:hypothetical protein [Nonomuraea antri]
MTPTPTPTTTRPPAVPGRQIVLVSPGDYIGSCVEPVPYHATGSITLPAGAAQTVTAWWIIDGVAGPKLDIPFPASTQARAYLMNSRWSLGKDAAGTHQVGLMVQGGPVQPDTRSYTFTCDDGPNDATLTFRYARVPHHTGDCDAPFALNAAALFMTDRETQVKYRLVADGKPGPVRTKTLKPNLRNELDDLWNVPRQTGSGSGTVRIEVLNHNKPYVQYPYTWTCVPKEPDPGTVRIGSVVSESYHGDCSLRPSTQASARLHAAPGTAISFRWLVDGRAIHILTQTTGPDGFTDTTSSNWAANPSGGTLAIEVVNHNKPVKQVAYQVQCT